MKIKTTLLLTLFLGLSTVYSTAQNRWLPDGDYRLYQSQNGILGYEASVQNAGDDTVIFLNYVQFNDVNGVFLINGNSVNLYHYFKDSLSAMLPGKYVASNEVVNILNANLWLKNNPIANEIYIVLDSDSLGNNWLIESEANWNYSSEYHDSALKMTFDIKDSQGDPANHPWNGKHLLFGKSKGLLEFPDKAGHMASLIYSEAQNFGDAPTTWSHLHDVEVGAEIHTVSENVYTGGFDTTLRIRMVLSANFQNQHWMRIDSVWETSYRYVLDSNQVLGPKDIYHKWVGIDTTIQSTLLTGQFYHQTSLAGFDSNSSRFVHLQLKRALDPSNPIFLSPQANADFNIKAQPPYAYINALNDPADVPYYAEVYYAGLGGPYRRYTSIGGSTNDYIVYAKNSSTEWGEPLSKSAILSTPAIKHEVEVNMYPNPASNKIHLSGLHGSFDYQVLNIRGQLVQNGKLPESDHSINTSEFTDGVYFLQLQSGTQMRRAKFIVRH